MLFWIFPTELCSTTSSKYPYGHSLSQMVVSFFLSSPHSCLLVAGATSEGVLANFFNSLLSKKTGSPGGPGGVGGSPGGGSAGGTGSNLPPSAKKSGMLKRSAHNLD